MNLLSRFRQHVKEERLFSSSDRLLIAVSGGVDSMVLARLCFDSGYKISIAHCNFRLRGKESDEDEAFVAAFASSLQVPFFSKGFDTEIFASAHKMGIQEAARTLRYEWFLELKESEAEADKVLTAHHADDHIETLMMNFFKGTGIRGLQGIPSHSGHLVRPLLFAWKEEIKKYAEDSGISFREDASNISSKYTRNYFRNELIPSVEKVFPGVKQNLFQNLRRFSDIGDLYREAIGREKRRLMEAKGNEYHIPIAKLAKSTARRTLLYEIIADFGFTAAQVDEVAALMQSGSGKYVESSSHRILNNRGWLIIASLCGEQTGHVIVQEGLYEVSFGAHVMRIESLHALKKISPEKNTAQLDARHIVWPLLLRKWKQGDYFYPLGMPKKKKISRFLIDEKIPLLQKEDVWVLESEGRIVWVVGHRIDDRFKVTEKTKEVLRLVSQ